MKNNKIKSKHSNLYATLLLSGWSIEDSYKKQTISFKINLSTNIEIKYKRLHATVFNIDLYKVTLVCSQTTPLYGLRTVLKTNATIKDIKKLIYKIPNINTQKIKDIIKLLS